MKKVNVILCFVLFFNVWVYAQKIAFDSKYVTVGVISNEWPSVLNNDPNIRRIGNLPIGNTDERSLVDSKIGKKVLDLLLQRDKDGLHMDRLYEQALQNTTIEEVEIALKDISAESKDVLKREIAHQLLKNNYIIVFKTITDGKKTKKYWNVYHVEIDDKIIEQTYLNWRNLSIYDKIDVPIKFVAKGKVKRNFVSGEGYDELVYDIAKKVPAFAVRGPVVSRYPFEARIGSQMGVSNSGRIYVYRFKEDNKGNLYSKKICTTRATDVSPNSTRMFTISGTFPSTKKGDIAVLRDHHRSSVSLMGQASFGDDARYGGRMQYEYLLDFSKHGVAQSVLAAIGYNRHNKEPEGIWWDDSKSIQPVLNNANFSVGYGVGFNILGRIEIMPYLMAGYQYSFVTGGDDHMYYWDNDYQYPGDSEIGHWINLSSKDKDETTYLDYHSFIAHGGARVSVNLWYPLQLLIGADYNFGTKKSSLSPLLERHTINRINFYAGLRLHL